MSPARKSRVSRSRKADLDRYGWRPTSTRPPLPVIVIVCDDACTAIRYFEHIKKIVKQLITIEMVAAPRHGATAAQVAATARTRAADLRRRDSRDRNVDRDAVWALIDLEGEPHLRDRAYQAKEHCHKHSTVRVALSNPCFELWTLLHLEDTGRRYANCQEVIKKIKSSWNAQMSSNFHGKTGANYAQLIARIPDAMRRADALCKTKSASWTEVHMVLQSICEIGGCDLSG